MTLHRWMAAGRRPAAERLTTDERTEGAALRREGHQLRQERDILKKPRPSSPSRPSDLRVHSREEGRLSDSPAVPRARRLAERLLRVAIAAGLAAHPGRPAVAVRDPPGARGKRGSSAGRPARRCTRARGRRPARGARAPPPCTWRSRAAAPRPVSSITPIKASSTPAPTTSGSSRATASCRA